VPRKKQVLTLLRHFIMILKLTVFRTLYEFRPSFIQVAELVYKVGTLICDLDTPFDFYLPDLLLKGKELGR